MRRSYLEVTFRGGRPLAAYYYLPRTAGRTARRTRRLGSGMIADLDEHGVPIGIEITAPSTLTLAAFNEALDTLAVGHVGDRELAPLRAA